MCTFRAFKYCHHPSSCFFYKISQKKDNNENEKEKATDWIVIVYTTPDNFISCHYNTKKCIWQKKKTGLAFLQPQITDTFGLFLSLASSLYGKCDMFLLTLTCVCVFWLFVLSRLFTVFRPFNNLANVVLFFVSLPSAFVQHDPQCPNR